MAVNVERLSRDFLRVCEVAAVACARTMGQGDRRHSDHVATESMRKEMDAIAMRGTVVIGEGERDEAPMLFIGEKDGSGRADDMEVDIAVDPLEGTNLCATGANNAITVLAASNKGGLLHAPDCYMEKIIVGPSAKKALDIEDLVVIVLARPRHEKLIADIRKAGARIKLIGDGDLSAGISAAVRRTNVHAVMGSGAPPEGVPPAARLRGSTAACSPAWCPPSPG